MSRTITWRVRGMHCASCERAIEQTLKDLPGVINAEASLKQGRAGVEIGTDAKEPDFVPAYRVLKELGYVLQREEPNQSTKTAEKSCPIGQRPSEPFQRRLIRALSAITVTGILVLIILGPIRRIAPSLALTSSFGVIFLFGVLASVSTCLASTGGFILAYASRAPSRMKNIGIHAGRLVGFVSGGAILGTIGGSLPSVTGNAYGIIALVLGLLFLAIGFHMLDLSPSLASIGIKIPKRISALADRASASKRPYAPLLVGASTFFLPCGFTQTAQALALASGSAFRGALIMGAFALGTLPVLGGISTFGNLATLKHRFVRLAAGAILVIFAIGQIDGGLTILGSRVTPGSILASVLQKPAQAQTASPPSNQKEQVIRMAVSYTYIPSNLVVRAGIPVRWEIDGKDINGCSRELVVPAFNIRKTLKQGPNVITFTPTKTGTIPFSCGMGMIRGTITVTN